MTHAYSLNKLWLSVNSVFNPQFHQDFLFYLINRFFLHKQICMVCWAVQCSTVHGVCVCDCLWNATFFPFCNWTLSATITVTAFQNDFKTTKKKYPSHLLIPAQISVSTFSLFSIVLLHIQYTKCLSHTYYKFKPVVCCLNSFICTLSVWICIQL